MRNQLLAVTALTLASSTAAYAGGGDDCASAVVLADGAIGAEPFDTTAATASGVFPSCGGGAPIDTWFQWSPDADGGWIFSTCNTANYDSRLAVWDACNGVQLGCNDDAGGCTGLTSQVTVSNLLDASSYWLQVGGFNSEIGSGTFDITALGPPPANDDCANATVLPDGAGSIAFDSTAATNDGPVPSCGGPSPPIDIWYQWSPDADGDWSIGTSATSFGTRLTLYDGCMGTELECAAGFFGGTITALGLLDANDYWIQVTGGNTGSGTGMLDIAPFTPPTCGTPTVIPAGPNSVQVDTTLSTASGLNPGCGGGGGPGGGAPPIDEFLEWSPDVDGTWVFSTCSAATYDTRLALFDACTGGQVLACNDDACGLSSTIAVPGLLAAATYFIQVGGFANEVGTCTVDISLLLPPANDDCANATPVAIGSNLVDNTGSSVSGLLASGLPAYVDNQTPNTACEEFGNGAANMNQDVFYTFTPASGSAFLFSTCNMAGYDTKLAIYSGTCGAPVPIACNDDGDGCSNFSSELRATGLAAGSTYILQVGGFAVGETGTATLDVSEIVPPQAGTNVCMTATNSAGAGMVMGSTGTPSVANNDLALFAEGGPVDEPGLFYYGSTFAMIPFGEGFRCISGTTVRLFPVSYSDVSGTFTRGIDNTAAQISGSALPIAPGVTYLFQCWYRDPACPNCNGDGVATGFNLSDAYQITFVP